MNGGSQEADPAGATSADAPRAPAAALLAYTAPLVPVALLQAPALSVMPALYAKHTAIDVAVIGVLLTLTRLVDVAIDPLIGFLSDRTRSRLGARKPWIVLGGLVSAVAVYYWFRPGPDVDAVYFLCASIAACIGWSMIEIPHAAWMCELTADYDQRSRVASYRVAAQYLAIVLFMSAPLLPIFSTTEMTPEVTGFVSWVVIALIPLTVACALLGAPSGERASRTGYVSLREVVQAALSNRPLRVLLGAALLSNLSSGMVASLYFFFIDVHLGILDKFSHVALTVGAVSLAALPAWRAVLAKVDRHRILALASTSTALTLAAMAFLKPGPLAFPLLMLIFALSAAMASGSMVAQTAIMADIVDYDEWKTRVAKAANYYALLALCTGPGAAFAGGIALVIVGAFGFNPRGDNDPLAMAGFYAAFIGIPILLNLTAAVLIWRFPLTRRRHALICRRLARRERAASRTAAH